MSVKRKWFAKESTGVNADIERHRKKEAELRELIDNSDNIQIKKRYQELLNSLLDSKAHVTSNIGKSDR